MGLPSKVADVILAVVPAFVLQLISINWNIERSCSFITGGKLANGQALEILHVKEPLLTTNMYIPSSSSCIF